MALEALYDACINYLERQRTVLWGQSYDLGEEDDVEAAATWLTTVIAEVAIAAMETGSDVFRLEPTPTQEG